MSTIVKFTVINKKDKNEYIRLNKLRVEAGDQGGVLLEPNNDLIQLHSQVIDIRKSMEDRDNEWGTKAREGYEFQYDTIREIERRLSDSNKVFINHVNERVRYSEVKERCNKIGISTKAFNSQNTPAICKYVRNFKETENILSVPEVIIHEFFEINEDELFEYFIKYDWCYGEEFLEVQYAIEEAIRFSELEKEDRLFMCALTINKNN